MTPKTTNVQKGCGNVEFGSYTKCGNISNITNKKIICSKCKALKLQQEEFEKMIDEKAESTNLDTWKPLKLSDLGTSHMDVSEIWQEGYFKALQELKEKLHNL